MKKTILLLSFGIFLSTQALAGHNCFIAKENDKVILQEGDCKSRHAPCSTFKVSISLMGYNEGILIDETHPLLPFKNGYLTWRNVWKQPHNPKLWIENSCVWYSQIITQKLGMPKFKEYLAKFNYGNQDVSGDKGKDNGLTHSWLSSSLQISPEEQIVFLQKLLENKLPVSPKSHEMTKRLLFLENLKNGWKLYGKRGGGFLLNQDGTKDRNRSIGWFMGWIQQGKRTIVFAQYIEDSDKKSIGAVERAKTAALEKLMPIVKAE